MNARIIRTLRVTSLDTIPWEGPEEGFFDSQPEEVPMLVQRRIENLSVGQFLEPKFAGTRFRIERVS